jgi:hypothetical protein
MLYMLYSHQPLLYEQRSRDYGHPEGRPNKHTHRQQLIRTPLKHHSTFYMHIQLCTYATMHLCNYAPMQLCNYATIYGASSSYIVCIAIYQNIKIIEYICH